MKRKILVIDDEKLLVKSTCMALTFSGFDAQGVLDGEEGVRRAAELRPDLILLDIMMPGLDGWQVLGKLKENQATKNIPVVIFSAKEHSNGTELARSRGAVDYLAKPFDAEDMTHVIGKYCPVS
jgi:DNA-binding response OmpR family regulator